MTYARIPYESELSITNLWKGPLKPPLYMPEIFTDCSAEQVWDGRQAGYVKVTRGTPPLEPADFMAVDLADPTLLTIGSSRWASGLTLREPATRRQVVLVDFGPQAQDGRWTDAPRVAVQWPRVVLPADFQLKLYIAEVPPERYPVSIKVSAGDQAHTAPISQPGEYIVTFRNLERPDEVVIETGEAGEGGPGPIPRNGEGDYAGLKLAVIGLSIEPLPLP